MSRLTPPFAYLGGKSRMAERIVSSLPQHRVYVEPFAGSLAVFLAKPRARIEVVNDLNGDVVNFWRALRDHPDELERRCLLTPYSRAEYDEAWTPSDDPIEAARRFWVRAEQGVSGKVASKAGWRASTRAGRGTTPEAMTALRKVGRFAAIAERLAGTMIECRPAVDVIRMYDGGETLHYCDPPYVPGSHSTAGDYQHAMSVEDHHALADALREAEGTVILSGYPSDLYDDLFDGWHRTDVQAIAATAARTDSTTRRTEVLWSNRPLLDQLALL